MHNSNEIGVYPITVKESHLDTFGHINNATYLQILEEARWNLITERGFGLNYIQQIKQGPVILEVNIKFLKEIGLRENIKITTQLIKYEGVVGKLEQKIFNSKDALTTQAEFTFGLFDLSKRSLIPPTQKWKTAIGMNVSK